MKVKLVFALIMITSFSIAQEPEYIETFNIGYIYNDSLETKVRMNYPKGDSIWDLFLDKENGAFILQNTITKYYARFKLEGQKKEKSYTTYWAVTGKDTKCILNLYKDKEYATFEAIYGIMRHQYRRKL